MLPDNFNQRSTDKEAEKVREMIEKEPDQVERKRLQLLQYLLDLAAAQTRCTLELERNNNTRFEEHEKQLKKHEDTLKKHSDLVIEGKTTWKHILVLSTVLLSGFGYAYTTIDELKKSVSSVKLLEDAIRQLEDRSNLFNEAAERESFAKSIRKSLSSIEVAVTEQKSHLEDLEEHMGELETQMSSIQSNNNKIMQKKAFKVMK